MKKCFYVLIMLLFVLFSTSCSIDKTEESTSQNSQETVDYLRKIDTLKTSMINNSKLDHSKIIDIDTTSPSEDYEFTYSRQQRLKDELVIITVRIIDIYEQGGYMIVEATFADYANPDIIRLKCIGVHEKVEKMFFTEPNDISRYNDYVVITKVDSSQILAKELNAYSYSGSDSADYELLIDDSNTVIYSGLLYDIEAVPNE